ncbi:MAG: universal stress protein [Methanosphaera sp.]|nr:universal stress protein [Methanosphaera sp.]
MPVDGSVNSEQTIDYALKIAGKEKTEFIILHVSDSKRLTSIPEHSFEKDEELDAEDEGNKIVSKVKRLIEENDKYNDDMKISAINVGGHPAETILKVATIKEADVIVIATSGKHMINRFLLGSVTEKIIRQSRIPILVVPPLED